MARPLLMTVLSLGAAAMAAQACAQGAAYVGGDRYGPAPAQAQGYGPAPYGYGYSQPQAPAQPTPLRGPILSWPGKVQPRVPVMAAPQAQAASPAPYPYGYARATAPAQMARQAAPGSYPSYPPGQGYARAPGLAGAPQGWRPVPAVAAAPSGQPAVTDARYGAPPAQAGGWRPVYGPQTAPPGGYAAQSGWTQGAARPASAYPAYSPALAAARAAPPNRLLAADRRYGYDPTLDHSVRFYSVARPFGLRPDPPPIPPQFFTTTADLGGDPPGPLPVNHTTAETRATIVGGDSAPGGGSGGSGGSGGQ